MQSGLNLRVSAPIECRYQFRVRHRAFVERQIKHFQFRRRGKSHNGTFNLITQEDENRWIKRKGICFIAYLQYVRVLSRIRTRIPITLASSTARRDSLV